MNKMFGVAAVLCMGASVAHASVNFDKEATRLTTKEQKIVPHELTVASIGNASCTGNAVKLLPQCHN